MPKKLTTQKFISRSEAAHGKRYDYSKVDYTSSATKVSIICPEHGEFQQQPHHHMKGIGCPKCGAARGGNLGRLTQEEFLERSKKAHGDKYSYLEVDYALSNSKVCIICPEHGEFWQIPHTHMSGIGCPKCGSRLATEKLRKRSGVGKLEVFLSKAKEAHGNKYDYSKVQYVNSLTEVCIICPEHGEFWQKAGQHWRGSGCRRCSGIAKHTTASFVEKSREVHGDKYSYSLVDYKGNKSKVKIICPVHGEFEQIPLDHTKGRGCNKCGVESRSALARTSHEDFLQKAKAIHGNRYDYSEVKYIDTDTKVCIICPEHGEFWQIPGHHTKGHGCRKCSGTAPLTTEEFVAEARDIHTGKYNYSKVNYKNRKIKVCIICPEHGEFWQIPGDHSRGIGCPKCSVPESWWTVGKLREFVRSLLPLLKANIFTEAELLAICQQMGANPFELGKQTKRVLMSVVGKNVSLEEADKFASGEPSALDGLLTSRPDYEQQSFLEQEEGDGLRVIDSEDEAVIATPSDYSSGEPTAKNVLDTFESLKLVISADEELVRFLLSMANMKLWQAAVINEELSLAEVEQFCGEGYSQRVKEQFLKEYNEAKSLSLPLGYCYRYQPNLMQRLVATKLMTSQRVCNWSGTGAGKTLAAIYSSALVGARITLIICPDPTIFNAWQDTIRSTFPGAMVATKTFVPSWVGQPEQRCFLVLNYEMFQQEDSRVKVQQFVNVYGSQVDLVVIDEVHRVKQRYQDISIRRELIADMLRAIQQRNPNLYRLFNSATPVINNIREGVSYLELRDDVEYSDIQTQATPGNCIKMFQHLRTDSIRVMPHYEKLIGNLTEEIIRVDCSDYSVYRAFLKAQTPLEKEDVLLPLKLPATLQSLVSKTIVYTYYVGNDILQSLQHQIEQAGWTVGAYTGSDKSGLLRFLKGDIDVLVASSAISTGVDGLQEVCHRMIILSLLWTHAEYEQLVGRLQRQGQKSQVTIVIPQVYPDGSDVELLSYDHRRWVHLRKKHDLATACIEGVIPKGIAQSPMHLIRQADASLRRWLNRLEAGQVINFERSVLPDNLLAEQSELAENKEQRVTRVSNALSEWHRMFMVSHSSTMHERLQSNPQEWHEYHALYRAMRQNWSEVPFEVISKKLQDRPDWIIGDFGCGEALLAKRLLNKVYSIDHVAVDGTVIPCDMAHTNLENSSLDVVVFSLSLTGTNIEDYVKEAHRVLKPNGFVYVAEVKDKGEVVSSILKAVGFTLVREEPRNSFTYLQALK